MFVYHGFVMAVDDFEVCSASSARTGKSGENPGRHPEKSVNLIVLSYNF